MKIIVGFLFILLIGQTFSEKNYTDFIQTIKKSIEDPISIFYHSAYERLAFISDTYGPRMWGSQVLEKVIDEVYKMAKDEGFDDVRLEPVSNFTKWVRGEEELILHQPRPTPTKLNLIGLGGSVSGHIKAEALVVNNFDELIANKDQVAGKIVVYNQTWTKYGESVQYRSSGAWRAAQYGALAALVKSVTPDSIQSVHAGIQFYSQTYKKIPVAAITMEDAEMFARMQARKQKIILELRLENQIVPNMNSHNVVFDIKGTEKPEEILLMGGHIDSWDTGSQTGANDDAGGFITCFQSMRLLLKNGFRPKRTIRFIAWSGQEWGDPKNGANAYVEYHQNQLHNHLIALEDDLGSTKLYGFGYSGHSQGKQILQSVADQYLALLDAAAVTQNGRAADIDPLYNLGIPTMKNMIEDTDDHRFYFTSHHSAGDTMSIMNPDDLDSNVVGIAALFYILADLDDSIPKPNIRNLRIQ